MVKTYSYKKDANVKLSEHFKVGEFADVGEKGLYSDVILIDSDTIAILEKVYKKFNCSKVIISSGYRSKEHDIAVGGSGTGQHTLGKAVDFCAYGKDLKPISAKQVCCYLEDLGVYGIGYINENYTHTDTRDINHKWWGDETKANFPSITKFGHNSFYTYFGIVKEQSNVKKPSVTLGKYIKNGIDYGYVFDPIYYAENNKDVKKAFGYDTEKLFNHFIVYGMKEKRQAIKHFNVKKYKSLYKDLALKFGNNIPLYYKHYITNGYNENRKAI